MSECSRTHSVCVNECPCHGECANGCPCNNKYWKGSACEQFSRVYLTFAQELNLESSTWRVEIDELGILEGETYKNSYRDVVKFLGVPYAETPKEQVRKSETTKM